MTKHYVYILKSINDPKKAYVGLTSDLSKRLAEHNRGKSRHTSKYKPWRIEAAFWFASSKTAIEFEKYLKSGSGTAFRNKHIHVS